MKKDDFGESPESVSCPNPSELPEGRKTTYLIDATTGRLNSTTDADNSITTSYQYDNLGRVTRVEQLAGALDRVTVNNYDDVNQTITASQGDTQGHPLVTALVQTQADGEFGWAPPG